MADGAGRSAPACTWDRAVRARELQGGVVVHAAVVDDAAVAVVGVLAHADVGGYQHAGVVALDGAHRLLHDALGVVTLGAERVLLGGQAEEQHAADAKLGGLTDLLGHDIQRYLVAAGHGLDGLPDSVAVPHEHGVYELPGGEAGLLSQVAQRVRAAQAAQAGFREGEGAGHWC